MSSKAPDPNAPRPTGLQAMLARLRGMADSLKLDEGAPQAPNNSPSQAVPEALPVNSAPAPEPPQALPVEVPEAVPLVEAVAAEPAPPVPLEPAAEEYQPVF